ncbi:MAG: hypothetical protein IH614_06155 [Desulfuromonadales bacterium]|nr:hypothetical protein [Desulfuromonadales bacterium]
MFEVRADDQRLEIVSPLPWGSRLLFAILGLIPLLAPYELLWRIRWESYLHPFFLLAAVVAAGAVAVSGLFIFAGIAGLATRIVLDRASETFTSTVAAPVVARRTRIYPLSSLAEVDIRVHEWSDGAPSFSLRFTMADGTTVEAASSWSRTEVERGRAQVEEFCMSIRCLKEGWADD